MPVKSLILFLIPSSPHLLIPHKTLHESEKKFFSAHFLFTQAMVSRIQV